MTIPPPSPNYRTGKICYIEIPAIDISQSAQFYQRAFGWQIRQRNDGSTAFDDTIGEVSGTWVPGRPPSTVPGLLVYIMVASAATTIEAIIAAGGARSMPSFATLQATFWASTSKQAWQRSRHSKRLDKARPVSARPRHFLKDSLRLMPTRGITTFALAHPPPSPPGNTLRGGGRRLVEM